MTLYTCFRWFQQVEENHLKYPFPNVSCFRPCELVAWFVRGSWVMILVQVTEAYLRHAEGSAEEAR